MCPWAAWAVRGERERQAGSPLFLCPSSDPPSTCSTVDCEPSGGLQSQDGDRVSEESLGYLTALSCTFSKAPAPCLGHPGSSVIVLLKPTSLTGTKNIASQKGLGGP